MLDQKKPWFALPVEMMQGSYPFTALIFLHSGLESNIDV